MLGKGVGCLRCWAQWWGDGHRGGVLGRMVRGFESYKMRRGSILYTKVADCGPLGFEPGSLSPVGTLGYNTIQNL